MDVKGWWPLDTTCGGRFPQSKTKECFPLLMPTLGVNLSKVSKSYDNFFGLYF